MPQYFSTQQMHGGHRFTKSLKKTKHLMYMYAKKILAKNKKKNDKISQHNEIHVAANNSTNNNVGFFFVSDLRIVYYNNY